ncbi:YeeE/YedE thiosulfate transporter family protein [Falsiroseomonas sp. E2-1-a4]|uniref:YeeE/YedE thiosulfate transporter family protein n=1 Tax=Falsiroseomonas sp. E2-1-a4 TaxID=3239299 RepID=UPI003F2D1025
MDEGGVSDRGGGEVKRSATVLRHRAWLALLFLAVPVAAAAADPALDARSYAGPAWSPYLVGAGIGGLAWATFYFSDKPIGASSFYASVAGLIGKLVAPRRTESLEYFKENEPKVNWGFLFVVAAILGAAAAAWPVGEQTNRWIPEMWDARFGDSIGLRGAFAFAGGVLMAFGARLAGGCTSGHGISGTLQLNVASWIAVICFFIGGAFVAALLFRT